MVSGNDARMSQSVLYLEWMQPSWLPTRAQQRNLRWLSGLLSGLLFGLLFGLLGGLLIGLLFGLLGGLLIGLLVRVITVHSYRKFILVLGEHTTQLVATSAHSAGLSGYSSGCSPGYLSDCSVGCSPGYSSGY